MSRTDDAAEIGQTEELLIGIWRDVLGREEISSESDFFQLGGDSLQLMTLLFRIYQDTGIELDPGIVFQGPTVGQLAVAIASKQHPTEAEGVEGTI